MVLLDSTLPRSQYEYVLPQVSFTALGYHKHITLVFSPTVRSGAFLAPDLSVSCASTYVDLVLFSPHPVWEVGRHYSP